MNWGELFLEHWWRLPAMGSMLIASGYFSGTETALFNLTRGQLHRMANSEGRMGQLVAALMRRPGRLLQTLLLGNMIVNIAYSAMAAVTILALADAGLPGWALAATTLAGVLILILVGEVTPKMLAYRFSRQWAILSAWPTVIINRVFGPIAWILDNLLITPLARIIAPRQTGAPDITAEELAGLMELSARQGLISQDTSAILQEIVQLTDIRVADVMVPRVDIVAYDVDSPPAGLVELFAKTHLRKIPVYSGEIDEILGVVHSKRLLLSPGKPLQQLVAKVPFIPETANIERALLQLRVKRAALAIVVDEYGGLAGLITLEDIIEEIVGNIEETQTAEHDEPVFCVNENEYIIDGDLAIHEWVDAFQMDLGGHRISTIGGFVISLLGRIPSAGDEADYRNLHFTIEKMRGRRVSKLRLKLRQEAS